MKCRICGKRFVPCKENVYQAREQMGVISALTTPYHIYDVIDCPRCGCQVNLSVRMERVNATNQEEEESV